MLFSHNDLCNLRAIIEPALDIVILPLENDKIILKLTTMPIRHLHCTTILGDYTLEGNSETIVRVAVKDGKENDVY